MKSAFVKKGKNECFGGPRGKANGAFFQGQKAAFTDAREEPGRPFAKREDGSSLLTRLSPGRFCIFEGEKRGRKSKSEKKKGESRANQENQVACFRGESSVRVIIRGGNRKNVQ